MRKFLALLVFTWTAWSATNLHVEFTHQGGGGAAGGDVSGPISAVDNQNVLFDGTTGKVIKAADYTMPVTTGAVGTVLTVSAVDIVTFEVPAGGGDVIGPVSSVDGNITLFNGVSGNVIQDSGLNIVDLGALMNPLSPTPTTTGHVEIQKNELRFIDRDTPASSSNVSLITGDSDNPTVGKSAVKTSIYFREGLTTDEYPLWIKGDDVTDSDWEQLNAIPNYEAGIFMSADSPIRQSQSEFIATNDFTTTGTLIDDLGNDDLDFLGVPPLTTCAYDGGAVTFNGTSVDVTTGHGVFVDFAQFPGATNNYMNWIGATVALTVLDDWVTIYVDPADNLIKAVTGDADSDFSKNNVVLAIVNHETQSITDRRGACLDHGNEIRAALLFIGILSKNLFYSGNTDQTLANSAYTVQAYGISAFTDVANEDTRSAANPMVFDLFDRDTLISTGITLVPTDQYDAGALVNFANANRWGFHRIYYDAEGKNALQYGQDEFDSLENAVSGEALGRSSFIENPVLTDVYRYQGAVFFRANNVDLSTANIDSAVENGGIIGYGSSSSGGSSDGDVSGPVSSVDDNLVTFDGITGKVIKDSGIASADVVLNTATGIQLRVPRYSDDPNNNKIEPSPLEFLLLGTVPHISMDGLSQSRMSLTTGTGNEIDFFMGNGSDSLISMTDNNTVEAFRVFVPDTGDSNITLRKQTEHGIEITTNSTSSEYALLDNVGTKKATLNWDGTSSSLNFPSADDKVEWTSVLAGGTSGLQGGITTVANNYLLSLPDTVAFDVSNILFSGTDGNLKWTPYNMPTDDGDADQVLTTDGAGNTDWETVETLPDPTEIFAPLFNLTNEDKHLAVDDSNNYFLTTNHQLYWDTSGPDIANNFFGCQNKSCPAIQWKTGGSNVLTLTSQGQMTLDSSGGFPAIISLSSPAPNNAFVKMSGPIDGDNAESYTWIMPTRQPLIGEGLKVISEPLADQFQLDWTGDLISTPETTELNSLAYWSTTDGDDLQDANGVRIIPASPGVLEVDDHVFTDAVEFPDGDTDRITLTAPNAIDNDYTFILPPDGGDAGQFLQTDGAGTTDWGNALSGPISSTDNAIVRWDGTGGNLVQNSLITINDTGLIFANTNLSGIFQTGTTDTFFDLDTSSTGFNAFWRLGRFSVVDDLTFSIHNPGAVSERFRVDVNGVEINDAYILPQADGNLGDILTTDGAGNTSFTPQAGGGDVSGPVSSQDNGMVRFNGTSGKIIQDSPNFVTDGGLIDINLAGNGVAIQIDAPAGIAGKSSIAFQANRGSIGYDSAMQITTADTSKDIKFITDTNATPFSVMSLSTSNAQLDFINKNNPNSAVSIGPLDGSFAGIKNINATRPMISQNANGSVHVDADAGQDLLLRSTTTTRVKINDDGIFGAVTTGTTTLEMKLCGCKVNANGSFNTQYTEQCDLCFNGGAAQKNGTGNYILDFDFGFWLRAPVCNVTSSVSGSNDHFCLFREDTNSTSIIRVQCLDNNNNNSPKDENFYITCFGVE